MSLKDTKEEAEALLDSAEMTIESVPGSGSIKNELQSKTMELESTLEEAESEKEIREKMKEVKDLMDDLEDRGMDSFQEPEGDNMMPDEDVPPF
ncbi:MAG: hypothetical protein ABEK01_02940 [Candidatus Nanohaloarchaea archaeon]